MTYPREPWDQFSWGSFVLLIVGAPLMIFCVIGLPLHIIGLALWLSNSAPRTKINHDLYLAHWIALGATALLWVVSITIQLNMQ